MGGAEMKTVFIPLGLGFDVGPSTPKDAPKKSGLSGK